MPSLLTLPPQMLDAIFIFFDDLATLLAAASSCRRLYDIYNLRYNFFLPHVLRNALGGDGVIAASLRTLDVVAIIAKSTRASADQVLADIQALKEDRTDMPATLEQYKMHFDRARVVQQLEVLYSRSHKDRLTRTSSRLTARESVRFRLANHRLWLLGIYTRTTGIVQHLCLNADTRLPLFYSEYSAQDVYDIHSVLDWLNERVDECLPQQDTPRFLGAHRFQSLFAGPGNVLKAYLEPERAEYHLRYVRNSRLSRDAWKDDVRLVFTSRKLLSVTAMQLTIPEEFQPIVVLPDEPGLVCWGCGARPAHRLWNAENWDCTPRDLRLENMLEFLPSYLKHNLYERPLLAHYLGVTDPLGPSLRYAAPRSTLSRLATVPSMTVARILQALCDLPGIVNNNIEHATYLEQCAFFGITNAELLCGPCLRDFVKARFWLFWQSVKVGAAPWEATKQDCWIGFNCASQAVDPEHAYARNHACLDTWREQQARAIANRRGTSSNV